MLIGGDFVPEYNKPYFRIARLNADGSRDVTFNPGTGADGSVNAIVVQSDGKVLIGGQFISYNGVSRNGIARFHADGSLDASFNPGTGTTNGPYGGSVKTIALQPDGKVLIGGGFSSYNGTARNRIARLNADGSLDAGFNPGTGANSSINTLVLQSDGKVLIGGDFTTYNGTARNYIARLNADGSLDVGFNPGTGLNGLASAIVIQSDGKVLIGGDFTSYNGSPRGSIARVHGQCVPLAAPAIADQARQGVGSVQFTYGGTLEAGQQLEWSSDNTSFGNPGTTSPAYTLQAGETATFYARIMSNNGCMSAVASVKATAYAINSSVQVVQTAGSNSLSAPAGVNTATIQWLDANLQPIVGATSATFTPDASGTYYLSYVDANGDYQVSNAISFVASTTARTASLAAAGIQLYPNPTQGQLTVALATPGSYSLQLTDPQGRVVYTTTLSSSAGGTTTSLQLPSLAPGLYSVQVAGASGTYSGKLSVQ
ncbi:MAG: T9SS type A sorting domain-containing protein [Bacteroidetes bacterium]|nr:T9SS type A sorting domain-containing protein [Bacteroidota bacterium]